MWVQNWLIAAVCTLCLAVSGAHVKELTDANFERFVATGTRFPKEKWLIVFYSPKSARSMQVMAGLQTAAQTLGSEANVAKIDCSSSGSTLCRRFNVKSYPTISFVKDQYVYDHVGQRTSDDFIKFVRTSHKDRDAYEFPAPYSLVEDIQKELLLLINRLPEETEKMLTHAPFVGTVLFFVGTMSGFVIAILISLCCFGDSGSKEGRLTAEQARLLVQEQDRTVLESSAKGGKKGKATKKSDKSGADSKAKAKDSISEGDDFELVEEESDVDEGLGDEEETHNESSDEDPEDKEVIEEKKDTKKGMKAAAGGAKKGKKKNA